MEIIVLAMKDSVANKARDLATWSNKKAEIATDKFSAFHKEGESLKKRLQALEKRAGKWREPQGEECAGTIKTVEDWSYVSCQETTTNTGSGTHFIPNKWQDHEPIIAPLVELPTNTLPYRHLKLVKRGFRGAATLQVCGVSLESCPAWIWSLLLSDWKTIYVTDFEQYYSTPWAFVKVIVLIISRQEIVSMQGKADVGFASGSRAFLDKFDGPKGVPVVLWLERSGRRRPVNSKSRTWFGMSHETVGGSTTARGVFGREGLDTLKIPQDPLQRSITHILKYWIHQKLCFLPLLGPHYLVGERFSVSHVDKPVCNRPVFLTQDGEFGASSHANSHRPLICLHIWNGITGSRLRLFRFTNYE